MAPNPYKRSFSFTGSVSANPNFVPAAFGVSVDQELDQVAAIIASVEASLGQIQRSDGALANGIVTLDSMATGLLATFQGYVAASQASATAAASANASAAAFASTAGTAASAAGASATSAASSAALAGQLAVATGNAFPGPAIPATPNNPLPSGYNPNVFVPRLAKDNADDFVSFKRFRLATDSDDGVTIARALSLHPAIFVPAGDYLSAGPITLTQNGSRLHGAGRHNTRIRSTSATADLIVIGGYTSGLSIEKLSLGRTVAATAGAGISSPTSTSFCCIRDIYVENHWNGLLLTNTDFSIIQDLITQKNYNCGIYMLPAGVGLNTLQWSLANILSQQNDSAGLVVTGMANVPQVTMGDWIKVSTFGNSGCGMAFVGLPGSSINGIRVLNAFVGQDGNDEIFLDDQGGIDNTFTNVISELGGTGPTGRTGQTAASKKAHGFNIGPTNNECSISNLKSSGHSLQGLLAQGGGTTIINGAQCYDNGTGGAAYASGIQHTAGRLIGSGIVSGSRNGNQTQQYGLQSYDGNYCSITGGGLIGNKTKPAYFGANASAGAANLVNVLQG